MTALPRIEDGGGSGVELLERAIGLARGILVEVAPADLGRPTPCTGWTVADLLAHVEDGLDAFLEGSSGRVGSDRGEASPVRERVGAVCLKSTTLLGAWAGAPGGSVVVAGRLLPTPLVARIAALEIAVHATDVAVAIAHPASLPDDLAAALFPTAQLVVQGSPEFAPPVAPLSASATARLLALTGRTPLSPR